MEALLDILAENTVGLYIIMAVAVLYTVLVYGKGLFLFIVSFTKTKKDDKVADVVYKVIEDKEEVFEKVVEKAKKAKAKKK